MIVAEARTTAAAAGVAAAAAAASSKVTATKVSAAAAAEAEATNETVLPAQSPSSWASFEPWSSLLLGGQGRVGGDENEVQDRKLAEVRLDDGEQGRAILQDAARTRSDTAAFRDPNVRQWVERSVSLFCRERSMHYAQGLTELAAPWALITEPPCLSSFSYRCFSSFMERFAPNIFATAPDAGAAGKAEEGGQQRDAFVVLEAHLVLLDHLLRFHDPALAVHLDKCCAGPAAYATSWFVTLFARQMPVPALLHLWQRLAEHGDPVLVQFLALAWLVGNRGILLNTPREDVLKTVTRLRLASVDVVDRVFGDALALRESTPRLFCDIVRRACYSGGGTSAKAEPAAWTAAAADSAAGSTVNSLPGRNAGSGEVGPVHSATKTRRFMVGLLRFLRSTGVLTVDADQVAEILLAQPSAPLASAVADPSDEEDGRCTDTAPRIRGRFVLVDCRPPQEQEKGGGDGAASLSSGRASGVREEFGVGGRHVIWRRINPAESFAKQVGTVSELLRKSCGGGGGGGEGEGEAGKSAPPLEAVNGDIDGAPVREGVFEEIALEHEVGVAIGSDGDGSNNKGAVETLTHVCFIGMGGLGNSSEWSDSRFASPAEAEARAAAPEFRLALVASLTCLTPHVCVLEGGFPALDQAFHRKGFEDTRQNVSSVGAGNEKEPFAGAGHPPFAIGQESIDCPNGEVVATTTGSGGRDETRDESPRPDAAGGEGYLPADAVKTMPTTPADSSSPNPTSPSGGGGGGDPVPPSSFSRGLERKASRLAGNRRISEPFRVYAAKSADDMASGLRSLPIGASKSLEDAARVCNSLAKTNVRALGDSRLSLSRSVSRLEQLNARMDGTARGFARHFGAGWLRGEEIGGSQVED